LNFRHRFGEELTEVCELLRTGGSPGLVLLIHDLNRCPPDFDTIVVTHRQLEYLVDQYGADHVLVGTDYPADMGEVDPIGMIEGAPGLDDVERRAILGRNAARLLNLEIPAVAR
jgi:microsomal dipeptidase-like Zn-dependent dipeptidase